MKRIFLYSSLLMLIGMLTQGVCTKKSPCNWESQYFFLGTWKVTPEKDSINIGDTLTLFSILPTHLLDQLRKDTIDFSDNATINSAIAIFGLQDQPPRIFDAVDSLQFFSVKGEIKTDLNISPSKIKQAYFSQYNNQYILEFKMVAKRKGVYAISVSNAIASKPNGNTCRTYATVVLENDNTYNNIHYYRDLYYQGAPVSIQESLHAYCFKVK